VPGGLSLRLLMHTASLNFVNLISLFLILQELLLSVSWGVCSIVTQVLVLTFGVEMGAI